MHIKIQKARNELKFVLNKISMEYQLPGWAIDLILDSIRAQELQDQLSLTAELLTQEPAKQEGKADEN